MTQYKESDARVPGWKILRSPDKGTIRYRSPNGDEVGAWAYNSVLKHYQKTGVASPSPLGSRWKAFQKGQGVSSSKSHENSGPSITFNIPATEESIQIDLPESKNTNSSGRRSGLFTSKELTTGYSSVLIIVTSIVAMVLQLPEAQMSEIEVKAMAIPLGNITERSKYNKSIGNAIVGKVDYMQLAYAMYLYYDRVNAAMREKIGAKKSTGNAGPPDRPNPGNSGVSQNGNGGSIPGVPLRPASTGIRGFTGSN